MSRQNQNNFFKSLLYWFTDLICILSLLPISFSIWNGFNRFAYDSPLYRSIALALALSHTIVALLNQSYTDILKRGWWKEFLAVIKHNFFLYVLILAFVFAIQRGGDVSRMAIAIFFASNIIVMFLFRMLAKKIYLSFSAKQSFYHSVLLVTIAPMAASLIERFSNDKNIKLCGIADYSGFAKLGENVDGIPFVANSDSTLDYIKSNWVDEVLIILPKEYLVQDDFYETCYDMGVTVNLAIHRTENFNFPSRTIKNLDGITVLTGSYYSEKPLQMFCKRILDILGSVVGIILMALLFLIFAPVIFIQSPGPIFFSQIRVGKNGKKFKIFKFRTMYPDAEKRKAELMKDNKMEGHMFKMDDDPRIIPIGKFLRKTSIDETPQFLCTLIGTMSLVGTRPPTVDEYDQYDFHHKARLAMKPGITGMWQVSGRSDITDFEEIVKLDTQYIENWNFGLDIKIIFKTVIAVITGKGSE